MKKIRPISQIILAIASLSLIATYFLPLWRIDLWAPQYPEGLSMQIWLSKLSGDVEIINGLNHYIGMSKIKVEMFPEFKILPYIVVFYILFGLLAAFTKSLSLLKVYLGLIILAGVAALYDFWKWGYDYGHNLSDDAPIKVPGMAYQPPLIGYKTLLNFGAYSIPDWGGWIFIAVGVSVTTILFWEYYSSKKKVELAKAKIVVIVLIISVLQFSCSISSEPINYGHDACNFCKMTIMDKKFGSEIVTNKGKIFKFDDLKCLIKRVKIDTDLNSQISKILVNNFEKNDVFLDTQNAVFILDEKLKSPMLGNVAAFSNKNILQKNNDFANATLLTWNEIQLKLGNE